MKLIKSWKKVSMDFVINENELATLCGLPHIQQLAYLRGIRPYMDVKTGISGVKRRISHQSITEQLYVEPHQGMKSQNFSRAQIRRAIAGLERAGMITVESADGHLILRCNYATRDYFVQNKAVTNPSQKSVINPLQKNLIDTEFSEYGLLKAVTVKPKKADTPLYKDNYYIFLLYQFEQFWNAYPLKKSRPKAWEQFQAINPDEKLCAQLLQALQEQIASNRKLKVQGKWVASWKYPANWLAQQCWNDELTRDDEVQENANAHDKPDYSKQITGDKLWESCKSGLEWEEKDNAI
jgi:hypothetical protein